MVSKETPGSVGEDERFKDIRQNVKKKNNLY